MAMRMSARGASQVASKAKKLMNIGKAWDVGDKAIVLYPMYVDPETGEKELLVAAEWGYNVNDFKALGLNATFIPSNAEIGEDGTPVVPDVTAQFARLAPAFIAGEKEAKTNALFGKAWPTASAQKQAMAELEHTYDAKNNPNARKPLISRLQMYISTEVIYVPMKDDKPDWGEARLYSQKLSQDRITKLYAIMNDPMYNVQDTDTYLEVQYDFVAADNNKATAGRVQPVGIATDYRLKNRFPQDVDKLENLVNQLPNDSQIIKNHNYSYKKFSEAQLKSAFSNYAIMNCESIDTVPVDYVDNVINSAQLIQELSLFSSLKNKELKEKIAEAAGTTSATTAGDGAAPTFQELLNPANATDGASASTLLNNPAFAGNGDDEDLNDVDLG